MKKHIAEKIRQRLQPHLATPATPVARNHAVPPIGLDRIRFSLTDQSLNDEEIKSCVEDVSQGKVYTLESISRMLHCSYEVTRQIFMKEPGVVKVRSTYRVPETIFKRAVKKMMQGKV